jgi:leader peptidase (prepilin peptidase)/N-methyltransferase
LELKELLSDHGVRVFFAACGFLFGLVFGSFANVVIHRLPEREPEPGRATPDAQAPQGRLGDLWSRVAEDLRPDWRAIFRSWRRVSEPSRSRCPHCLAWIAAKDNLPVVSFLLLGGLCRHCRAPISWRYPAVELLNGMLWAGIALVYGPNPKALLLMLLATALVALAAIDAEIQQLPDAITIPGVLVGLAASQLNPWPTLDPFALLTATLAAVAGYLALAILGLGWGSLRGVEGFGQGDWKMVAMLGAFLGAKALLLTVLIASFAGSLVGVVLIRLERGGWQSKLPLGTFLSLAGILVLFIGDGALAWYSRLLDV